MACALTVWSSRAQATAVTAATARGSFVAKQVAKPGCWDGQLLNGRGERYVEAVHGLDPLRKGFSFCAPAPAATTCFKDQKVKASHISGHTLSSFLAKRRLLS